MKERKKAACESRGDLAGPETEKKKKGNAPPPAGQLLRTHPGGPGGPRVYGKTGWGCCFAAGRTGRAAAKKTCACGSAFPIFSRTKSKGRQKTKSRKGKL
eukprot:TRINITY_DN7934_c0_g1_i1.p8 TRINITY_DN7934_c0_g1~~TRINITY_DN7934_c0_g1_i1.p8  ORF type:complete len:100 (-),score=0.21 TRINITY_DN7934_c0_g1_i1:2509-2808(-)